MALSVAILGCQQAIPTGMCFVWPLPETGILDEKKEMGRKQNPNHIQHVLSTAHNTCDMYGIPPSPPTPTAALLHSTLWLSQVLLALFRVTAAVS